MQKILFLFVILLAITCHNFAYADANTDSFSAKADKKVGKLISFYQKMTTCEAGYNAQSGIEIIGPKQDRCHIYNGFIKTTDGKNRYPMKECYVPMNEIKDYASLQISKIKSQTKATTYYSSFELTNELDKYCKPVNSAMKISY